MAVLGLTGELASGKSAVLKRLKTKGAIVFDADRQVHRYYRDKHSPVYKKVAKLFPQALAAGFISRKKLAKLVFSRKEKLRALEKIVHPQVINDLLSWVKKRRKKSKIYVAEVPLLFEQHLEGYFDQIILVVARKEALTQRIIKKYNLSDRQAGRRLSLYLALSEKIRRSDYIVDNSLGLGRLQKEVDLLWKKINQNQKSKKP